MPGISASRVPWNRGDFFKPHVRFCLSLWLSCVLGGCGGGGSGADQAPPVQTFTVGGTVEGLSGTIVLQDNGADSLSIAENGAFTFPAAIAAGGRYTVTVLAQPAGQTCTVGSGEGITSANVSAVSVHARNVILNPHVKLRMCGTVALASAGETPTASVKPPGRSVVRAYRLSPATDNE